MKKLLFLLLICGTVKAQVLPSFQVITGKTRYMDSIQFMRLKNMSNLVLSTDTSGRLKLVPNIGTDSSAVRTLNISKSADSSGIRFTDLLGHIKTIQFIGTTSGSGIYQPLGTYLIPSDTVLKYPRLLAGTNISLTGTYPNQTINALQSSPSNLASQYKNGYNNFANLNTDSINQINNVNKFSQFKGILNTADNNIFYSGGNIRLGNNSTVTTRAKLEVFAGQGKEQIEISPYEAPGEALRYTSSNQSFNYPALTYHSGINNVFTKSTAEIAFIDKPGTYFYADAVRATDIQFRTTHNWNGTTIAQFMDTTMSIMANNYGGSIGIRTTSPQAALHVNGDVILNTGNQAAGKVWVATDATGRGDWQVAATGSTGGGTVTNVTANAPLSMTGNITINPTINVDTISTVGLQTKFRSDSARGYLYPLIATKLSTASAASIYQPLLISGGNIVSINGASTLTAGNLQLLVPSDSTFLHNQVIANTANTVTNTSSIATQATQIASKENSLGNPSTSGWLLSSTTGGVRSWIAPPTGGGAYVDLSTAQTVLGVKAFQGSTTTDAGAPLMVFKNSSGISAFEFRALTSATNTAIGVSSFPVTTSGVNNTGLGYATGLNNTTGSSLTLFGYQAGQANTTGGNNNFIGSISGFSNTSGNFNTFAGYSSGYANTTGNNNTYTGYQAGNSNVAGGSSIAMGYKSAANATSLNNTIAIGQSAARTISGGVTSFTTSTNGIYIGDNVHPLADNATNENIIGANGTGNGSNTTTIANPLFLPSYGAGTITGTPAYNLQVNAAHQVIETPVPSAGSTGTVTNFSKTDNFGITSTVTNPTTTPNYSVTVDTTVIQSKAGNVALLATKQPTGAYLLANQTITATGDVTGSGTTSLPLTLATVTTNVGSFGTASAVPTQTINGKGLTTTIANTPILITESQVTSLTTDLSGKETGLGNPSTNGYVLSSTTTGTRSWVAPVPTSAVTSGTYTPTMTAGTNISTIIAATAFWTKTGNFTHVRISGTLSTTAGGASFSFTLPNTCSEATLSSIGVCSIVQPDGSYASGLLAATSSSTAGYVGFVASSTGTGAKYVILLDYTN